MQCTSFLPGSYSTRDINVGARSIIWPLYNNDLTLKTGQSFNVFLPRTPMDQCSGYDKERFRQTILEHEATFKDQVHELHRLYKRQRELMDEVKRSELSKQELQLQIRELNPSLVQNLSGCSQNTWEIPSLPRVNPAGSEPSVSHSQNYKMPYDFNPQKSMQVDHDPARIEKNSNDCKSMESKSVRSKRRVLDLELPADEYIDGEDGEGFGERVSEGPEAPCYTPKRMSEVVSKSDFNLFPDGGLFNSVSQGGSSSRGPFSGRANNWPDLNGPGWIDNAVTPNSGSFLGFKACHGEIPSWEQDLSGNSTSSFRVLSKEILCNIQGENDAEDWSKIESVQRGRQWELPQQNGEAGQSRKGLSFIPQISSPGKLSTPSVALNVEPRTEYAMVNKSDSCDGKLWVERPNFSSGNWEGNRDLTSDNYLGHTGSSVARSCQLLDHSNETKTEPSALSFRRNPIREQNPTAGQALPCFNIPLPLSGSSKSSVSRLSGKNFHLSHSSVSSVGSGTHFGNSFSFGSKSEFRTLEAHAQSISINNQSCNSGNNSAFELHSLRKCFKDSDYKGVNSRTSMDLNFLPRCLLDTEAFLQNTGTVTGAKKLEELGPLSWCVEKPDSSGRLNIEREDSTQMNSVFSQLLRQYVRNGEPKRFEFSNSSTDGKILESSSFDRPHSSNTPCAPTSSSTSLPTPFEDKDNHCKKVGLLDINLPHNTAFISVTECTKDNPDMEIGVDDKFLEAGNHIDLNSCINEDESSTVHTTPRVIMKATTETDLEAFSEKKEIDLEAPVSPENKECSPPRGESEENQLETPLQMSMPEPGDLQAELVMTAAKVLVEISSYVFQKQSLEDYACNPSVAWRNDSLHWFASVVPLVAGKLENGVGVDVSSEGAGDQKELSSNECDSFEAMTLKLGEIEAECYCCDNSSQKEEETSAISSPNQPRKGRLRKGRPGKDFQTEVLPSITSLSRLELKEDLQTIGGLMKAAGTLLTIQGTRNMGRYRCTRARRQSINPHCNMVESKVGSPLKQQTVDRIVVAIEERFLTGWGKTKSRRRGQRFAASNPARLFS